MTGSGTRSSRKVHSVLLATNAVGASASAMFAVVGLVRPGYVQPGSSMSPLAKFWAASSAGRTWAITGPLLVGIARGGRPAPPLLMSAGIVQLMDSGLGVWQRNPRMAVLPAAMGLLHLATARVLTTTNDM